MVKGHEWNGMPFDEYLLIELFSPTGLNKFDCDYQYSSNSPQGPNTLGIRLWHVDSRLTYEVSAGGRWGTTSYSTTLTSNVQTSNCTLAFSNTYNKSGYGTVLGSSYDNYNLLQLIRNNTSESHKTRSSLSSASLFKQGDSFDMTTYKSQFVKKPYLNSGIDLGWSFSVDSITNENGEMKATITCTKA